MEARFVSIAQLTEAPCVAVIVDVMRAFTVTAWAFARGAEKVVLAETLSRYLPARADSLNLSFSLADPERLRRMFGAAGFRDRWSWGP